MLMRSVSLPRVFNNKTIKVLLLKLCEAIKLLEIMLIIKTDYSFSIVKSNAEYILGIVIVIPFSIKSLPE